MPYRSWCHHCVGGRGRERDHTKKGDEEQQGIPEYHMDYCFPGVEFGERLTVLVVIEKYTKMKKAVVVPNKGSTGGFAAKMVLDLIFRVRGQGQGRDLEDRPGASDQVPRGRRLCAPYGGENDLGASA